MTGFSAPSIGAIGRLEQAFRDVLLDGFEEQFHSLAQALNWYRESLPAEELFRLWVSDNYEFSDDPLWIFQPLRASERTLLCKALGIAREESVGLSPQKVSDLVFTIVGLPLTRVADLQDEMNSWKDAISLLERGEDEKASVQLRSLSERLLKRTLHFHCATGCAPEMLDILRTPGHLRVPTILASVARRDDPEATAQLVAAFADEGWADLGFLTIALRKLSSRVDSSGKKNVNGERLLLLLDAEADTFARLAQGLQAYVHDKPSVILDRRANLEAAAKDALASAQAMIQRRVVPEEALVLQAGQSILGLLFHGYSGGRVRILACESLPTLGKRILFTMRAERDYSVAMWTPSFSRSDGVRQSSAKEQVA